ncbi:two-component system probable response regulator PhcQ [Prosthecobacter fusiformis]|uniref:histidine kinase n=1 Tax=Prosthecobacter fusiformis TaxID=48464 RepID=A0A4R7RHY5_9BACT|nr:hybrid sensor histidine kinase/response regulator [Prosthecobacter fusiformis]TDU62472.1 two-component system probable response regulator PhcQ [Prosthecobacter fusiformis]
MQNLYDYKRYAVLYVDDEEMALKYFEKTFGNEFRILTATNANEGLKLIESRGDEIGVLLTDQRMPGQKGVQLLERARQIRPKIVRMMITAFADFGVTVDAVNLGNVFRYVSKPLQVEDMRNTLRRAMEFFLLQRERDDLLREKLSVLQNMVITDRVISLGVLASGLCQNLRNPLEAVQTFLNLTPTKLRQESVDMDRLQDPSFWRDFHSQVLKQAGRISELIGELDGASLADIIKAETPVDPVEIIRTVVAELQPALAAKNIRLELELPEELPAISTEKTRFARIFQLLLQDEIDVLPAGSRLALTAKAQRFAEKPVSIQFTLQDDGPGLPQGALRSVFDPFAIRHEDAPDFGLNLMAVFFLVYHHGGHIQAENTASQGALFKIDIPLLADLPPSTASSSRDFVTKVLMNDLLWERLLAGD